MISIRVSTASLDPVTTFVVTMSFHNNTGHGMGRPRLSLATTEKPVLTSPATTEAVRAARLLH